MASSLSVAETLRPFLADPDGTGVFSDFDGTLSSIVDDPAAARPYPGVVDALAALARRYGMVGVVSGRPATFLRDTLGGRGLFLSGLYGLEVVTDDGGGIRTVDGAEPWRAVVDAAAAAAEAELAPGLTVERKGLSVTIHYRTEPGRRAEAEGWVGARAAATGLVLHPARMSYELRPPLERDKGAVVAEAAAGLRQICFLGDDAGDLSAFDALDRLGAAGATTVRVGVRSPEAPDTLLQRADVVVDGPAGSLSVLRALLGQGGR